MAIMEEYSASQMLRRVFTRSARNTHGEALASGSRTLLAEPRAAVSVGVSRTSNPPKAEMLPHAAGTSALRLTADIQGGWSAGLLSSRPTRHGCSVLRLAPEPDQ